MRPFHNIAGEYCAWVERSTEPASLAEWLPRILAELLHAAFSLPDDGLVDAGTSDFQRRDSHQIRAALPSLPCQYYREVPNALDLTSDEAPAVGDLYDDLVDIYSDLSEGLHIHEHHSPAEARRYWRQSFRYHWGEHVIGALCALYSASRESAHDA